jgi:hypothetical protein
VFAGFSDRGDQRSGDRSTGEVEVTGDGLTRTWGGRGHRDETWGGGSSGVTGTGQQGLTAQERL